MLRRLVALGIDGLGLAAGLGLRGGQHWRLDLLAHFRVQVALGLLVLAAVATLGRWWRWVATAGGLVALHAVAFAPYVLAGSAATSGPTLRLLHFNVLTSNQRTAEVAAYIAGSGADVVVVQEVDARWAAALATVPGYAVIEALPRRDNLGMAVLGREGFEVADVEALTPAHEVPALAVGG